MASTSHKTKSHVRLVMLLGGLTFSMFAFGYALVPLFDVFCEITGIGGRTGRVDSVSAEQQQPDLDRSIKIEFTASTAANLPWKFAALTSTMKVNPGKVKQAIFLAENVPESDIVGQATPSVAPSRAGRYFKKTECFCFTNQLLKAGEQKEMLVSFIVDPDIPADVTTITLSYSFFNADKYATNPDRNLGSNLVPDLDSMLAELHSREVAQRSQFYSLVESHTKSPGEYDVAEFPKLKINTETDRS